MTACEPQDSGRLKRIRKGQDEGIASGTASSEQVISAVAGDCAKARRELATALNDGGFARYSKKRYAEAIRFWAAALVARPGHVLARYNLACGLALERKVEDALWAIEELVRAAREGDARASLQLEKAKSDGDLHSLRGLPRFSAAVAATTMSPKGFEGPRRDPALSAEAVKLLPKDFFEDRWPHSGELVKYAPALVQVWTWRPDEHTEIVAASVRRYDVHWVDLAQVARGE